MGSSGRRRATDAPAETNVTGSIADGTADADSDVDLVVMGVAPADYWALRRELEQALGRPVDLHTQDDDPAFVTKAIARGQQIYGQDS